jgi:hypothetical protein
MAWCLVAVLALAALPRDHALPVQEPLVKACPNGTLAYGMHCICGPAAPVCVGPRCSRGRSQKTNERIQGFRAECIDCACVPAQKQQSSTQENAQASSAAEGADGDTFSVGDLSVVQHAPEEAARSLPPSPAQGQPRVLIMTVATHREPFIELTERSVGALGAGAKLLVAGQGEFFFGACMFVFSSLCSR